MVTDEMVEAGHADLGRARGLYVSEDEVRAAITAALAASPPPTGEKMEAIDAADHKARLLDEQIGRLADFIMAEVPGEPSQSEGAVDTAIRWMRAALTTTATTNARVERLEKALQFYANPEHWRTQNADGSLGNSGYGLGYHRTGADGVMEVLGANCGRWVGSKFEVHGGHWQADAGHVARAALTGGEDG